MAAPANAVKVIAGCVRAVAVEVDANLTSRATLSADGPLI
jgi:hypothetical protein